MNCHPDRRRRFPPPQWRDLWFVALRDDLRLPANRRSLGFARDDNFKRDESLKRDENFRVMTSLKGCPPYHVRNFLNGFAFCD